VERISGNFEEESITVFREGRYGRCADPWLKFTSNESSSISFQNLRSDRITAS
jgi:hypothetical protein